MKKGIALSLVLLMVVFAVVGCGGAGNNGGSRHMEDE